MCGIVDANVANEVFGEDCSPAGGRFFDWLASPRGQLVVGGELRRELKGPATFDFLGFTMYWRRTRRGRWEMWCKTRSKGLRRFNRTVSEWCRRHRHLPVQVQHAALTRRVVGHFNYFGVNGNARSLARVRTATIRVWFKWLRRRSQRTRLTWERFGKLLETLPPSPRRGL